MTLTPAELEIVRRKAEDYTIGTESCCGVVCGNCPIGRISLPSSRVSYDSCGDIARRLLAEIEKEKTLKKEKWEPKTGDRVSFECTSKGSEVFHGKIETCCPDGTYNVIREGTSYLYTCTRRQLRRIRPKKRREYTLICCKNEHGGYKIVSGIRHDARCPDCTDVVFLRELREAK